MIDKLKANAQLVVEQMRKMGHVNFGFDVASVEILEGFIERQRLREDITEELVEGLVDTLGSYLGQCVVVCYGGEWKAINGKWAVAFNTKNSVFPFSKVQKQFESGTAEGESVKSFFESIPVIFPDLLRSRKRKPWWKVW